MKSERLLEEAEELGIDTVGDEGEILRTVFEIQIVAFNGYHFAS